ASLARVDSLGRRLREGVVDGRPRALADRALVVLARGLEQRRVDVPHERPRGLVDEPGLTADLETCRAEKRARVGGAARGEEHRVARLRAGRCGEPLALCVGKVLRDGTAELAVLAER